MAAIRTLTAQDLPAVAALYQRMVRTPHHTDEPEGSSMPSPGALRAWPRPQWPLDTGATTGRCVKHSARQYQPPPGLAADLLRLFLDQPLADDAIPSLVAQDRAGRVVGFMGCSVRRMRFDGRPLRLACSGPMVAAPEAPGIGALMMRRFLAGPQDLSITDGATETVAEMWCKLGGRRLGLTSLHWVAFLAPVAFAVTRLQRHRLPWLRPVLQPLCLPFDAAAARLQGLVGAGKTMSEELTASALVGQIDTLSHGVRLRPAYDLESMAWLFAQLERLTSRGTLLRRLVRDPTDGRVLGWHVGFVERGGLAEVLQMVAAPKDGGAVLDDLLTAARAHGATAVRGRLEPHLLAPLGARRLWSCRGLPGLVHARDPAVLSALALGEALLTRLDGEWWMALHREPYAEGDA